MLPGCWKSDLEAVSPQLGRTEMVPALLEQLPLIPGSTDRGEKKYSVYVSECCVAPGSLMRSNPSSWSLQDLGCCFLQGVVACASMGEA